MTRLPTLAGAAALGALLAVSLGSPAWGQGKWECPAAENTKKNPVAAGASALAAGKKLSADKACTACHGETGKGDGLGAAALNPKPANWTLKAVQDQTDGCFFWKITTGRGAMPPWKDSLSENERWQLVHYLRSLKGK